MTAPVEPAGPGPATTAARPEIVVHGVGDVFVNRPDPVEAFSLVGEVLRSADVVFGNCEAPIVEGPKETRDTSFVAGAASATGLRSAGFNLMSCANNHVMDEGPNGLLSTLALLRAAGVATAGGGMDEVEARRPAVVRSASGATIALVAYASFFRLGDVATDARPGIATVGGETVLQTPAGICSPGVAPIVTSVPDPDDLDAMVADIARARSEADLVLASFHWGDATRPSVLTDHEHRVARLAIDAGADAVIGHHHHVLRGVDSYRSQPIFYGLGNFVWDAPVGWAEAFSPETRERMRRLGKYAIRPRAGYPRLPFHPEGRLTMVARCRFRGRELAWSGFVPCAIRPDGLVEPLDLDAAPGRRVLEFVRQACEDFELPVTIDADSQERVAGFTAARILPAA